MQATASGRIAAASYEISSASATRFAAGTAT